MDGEVYDHDLPFDKISGKFRKNLENSLKYFVFDKFGDDPYVVRNSGVLSGTYVNIVPTVPITKDEVDAYLHSFMSDGYEGIMVRNPHSPYESGRSYSLQKFKIRYYCREYHEVCKLLRIY